jgi:hypothetical protein
MNERENPLTTRAYVRAKNARMSKISAQPYQDTMQVCVNGHKITGRYELSPQSRKDHCNTCGASTIVKCPNCQSNILGYLKYANVISSDDSKVSDFCHVCGEPYPWAKEEEADFMAADFGSADINTLDMDSSIKIVIQSRLDDAEKCLKIGVAMPVVFACGSAVEGMLFAYANPSLYNQAISAPKDSNDKVQPLSKWTLGSLIDVAKEVGDISESAKTFAHPLKNFRNYIHPREQVKTGFNPDIETAKVCYQVTKLIISNLEQRTTSLSLAESSEI